MQRPFRLQRRPSGTKNVLFAHDGALPSRGGAFPASEGPLLAQASALFTLTAPFEAGTGPPTSEGALLARRGVLCVRVSKKYVIVRVVIVT